MKILPLLDKVVVKEIKQETETKSGILLPSSSQEKACMAKVIAVGQGGMVDGNEVKMLVKEGDKILYSKFAGSEFKIDGEDVIVLKQADILAIVKEGE